MKSYFLFFFFLKVLVNFCFRNKEEMGSPIIQSYTNLFRFHLGSVAFGSFFIAFLQMIRAVLSFIEERCKDSQNEVLQNILRAVQCCLSCCDNILKYLTRNAYIEIGLSLQYNFINYFAYKRKKILKNVIFLSSYSRSKLLHRREKSV